MQKKYQGEDEQQPQELRELREKQYTRNNERITERDVTEVRKWNVDQGRQRRTERREESVRRKEYLRNRPIVEGEPVSSIEEREEKQEFRLRKYRENVPSLGVGRGRGRGRNDRISRYGGGRDERRDITPSTTTERSRSRSFDTSNEDGTVSTTHQNVNETISQSFIKGVENDRRYTEASITHHTRERRMQTQGKAPGMRGVRGQQPTVTRKGAGRGGKVEGSLRDYLGEEADTMLQPMDDIGYAPEQLEEDEHDYDRSKYGSPLGDVHLDEDDDFEDRDALAREYKRKEALRKKYRRSRIAEAGGPKSKKPIKKRRSRTEQEDFDAQDMVEEEESGAVSGSMFSARTTALPLEEDLYAWDVGMDYPDRTFEALLEETTITPQQQIEIDMANRRKFFEENLHRDDILSPEQLFLRDFGPNSIVDKLLSPLQTSMASTLEKKMRSNEITADELQLLRGALPGVFARKSHSSPRNVVDDLMDPDSATSEYTKILTDIRNETGTFANMETIEKIKLIHLRKLENDGRLTEDVLDAFEQKMPIDEFISMVQMEGFLHVLQNPMFNVENFMESQKLRGYASRKIRAERNGESEVPPLYTKEEWDAAMEKKEIDLNKSLTSKGFAMLSGIKPQAPAVTGYVPHLPTEINKAIHNRMHELKAQARERKSAIVEQRNRILESHAAVKHARLLYSITKFQEEYIGQKVPAPYIEDVISANTASKLGKNKFLMPYDRNFADMIESMPENTMGRFRMVQNVRALSRNDDLTLREKRYILSVLREKYIENQMDKVDERLAFDPRIAIRAGRHTHLHPIRKSLWDESYENWLETFLPPGDPLKKAAAEEKAAQMQMAMESGIGDEYE